ncbi:MAG: PucR family transcriptional regulator, partial [[Eubacterium] sulci]|nr:PucR family transcriptional regulator [[Eubacterium] sulci]
MRITVEDCLNLDAFKGSTVISCKRKMDRRVRTISVFDEIDYEKGIERNGVKEQMVLTH